MFDFLLTLIAEPIADNATSFPQILFADTIVVEVLRSWDDGGFLFSTVATVDGEPLDFSAALG